MFARLFSKFAQSIEAKRKIFMSGIPFLTVNVIDDRLHDNLTSISDPISIYRRDCFNRA